MITVHRSGGLRVVIFVNDHEPAHVHVFGNGQAKINLVGAGGMPQLVWAAAMKHGEVRRAIQIVTEQRDHLLRRWDDIHA